MALIIVAILLLAYLLIASAGLTKVSRAAVAIFAGTLCWVVYICYGTDFVMSQHPREYVDWLGGAVPTSRAVKGYIAQHVFLKHVGHASEIVLFLLATMTIVEILDNNGCFDFVRPLLRTRKSRRLLWVFTLVTLLISANLDNLTTTVMMLAMMHAVITTRRQRMVFGSAIVIAANCGGALTVIGDPAGLVAWNMGHVSATSFSARMLPACLVACFLPVWWIGRLLPERADTESVVMPYRGDDTNLSVWQRLLMLFVGIGGLWFIPTFHNITRLSPFLGALCVLAVLWMVNEIFNRKLVSNELMQGRRMPRLVQYGAIQTMLFVMGLMLAIGAVEETGAIQWLIAKSGIYIEDVWLVGAVAGLVSALLDNFATALTFFSLTPSAELNAPCWQIITYVSAVGGNMLCVGSMSGIALMRMERLHVGWYLRNVGWKAFVGLIAGFAVLYLEYQVFEVIEVM
ncbi:MAG: sodium:proton antiporter NhaD [Prevotella sp.]|nr:sodium:proton antiporter NhaD [Prevotella sp.]